MEGSGQPMIPCANCGFGNEPGALFCGSCGHALEAPPAPDAPPAPGDGTAGGSATPSTPASPHRAARVACPNCGFMNEADDLFCGSCRTPLGAATAPAAAATAAATPDAATPPAATPAPAPVAAAPAPVPAAAPTSAAATILAPPPPKPPQSTIPLKPGEIACPNCGTPNAPIRLFCVKCATQLRAEALPPKKPPLRLHRGMILPFVLSLVIGLGATIGGARIGAIVLAKAPQSSAASDGPGATTLVLPVPGGDDAGIHITPANPEPLKPIPPDKGGAREANYIVPTPSEANDPGHVSPWWSNTVPRIPAISQFDKGPLQKVNCVMASGAMLARLAFGIVTTGSQLRALQSDQDGASSYTDLNDAVGRGWDVGFLRGRLTPLQLRALSYAGAGVVVSLDYGAISPAVRLDKDFDGNHSVYLDAFTPNGPAGGPAYWVMDPIGKPWLGYKGGWWPAEEIERAGISRTGNGKIYATWAFAGGIVPQNHKVLPPDAIPGRPTAGPTAAPTISPTGIPASPDPMPTGNVDVPADDPDTGTPPPNVPLFLPIDLQTNVYLVDPAPQGLACTVQPVPASCPGGIIGVLGAGGANDPTAPPLNHIDVLYGTVIDPGTVQIVFSAPSGTTGQLWTWSGTGLPLTQISAQPATIGGSNVSIANISVSTSGTLNFFATATSPSYSGFSTVGTLVVGSGS